MIEFQCPSCGQTLKAPETAAGKKAKCPQCQQIAPIPAPGAPPAGGGADDFFADNLPAQDPQHGFGQAPQQPADQFPGYGGAQHPFGEQAPKSAPQNPYAAPTAYSAPQGVEGGPINPTQIDIGLVIGDAFETWKTSVGYLILVNIVMAVIFYAVLFAVYLPFIMMVGPENLQPGGVIPAGALAYLFLVYLVMFIVMSFLQAGQAMVTLDLTRGKTFDFGRLFQGGKHLVNLFVAGILLGLLYVAGIICLVIPGILVALVFFWNFHFLIVDDKSNCISVISDGWAIGSINILQIFVLLLVCFGITLLGLMACGIGLIVAIPLCQLIISRAYLMAIGER